MNMLARITKHRDMEFSSINGIQSIKVKFNKSCLPVEKLLSEI